MTTQQNLCENKASKVSNLRCGWSCQAISVTSVTLYDPRLELIHCMKSRQSFSRLTRPAGVWGSRASHSRITLTALRAFRKRPKTTVLQFKHNIIYIVTYRALVSHTFVFVYMREFGYYILFRERRNKGNHCGTTTDNQTDFPEHDLE